MSVYDEEWVFQDGALSTGAVGTTISDDVHNLQLDAGNIGTYDFASTCKKFAEIVVTVALTGALSTLNVQIVSASDAALATDVTVHRETGVFAFDDPYWALGSRHWLALDPDQDWQEFIGLHFVIAGAILTAGEFLGALTDHADTWRAYADRRNFGVNL